MEKAEAEKAKQVAAAKGEEYHVPWLSALAAHECLGLSFGWTHWSSMEKAVAEKGKQVVAAEEEEEDHASWLAAIGAEEVGDLSSGWSQTASNRRAVSSAVAQSEVKLLTDAQIRKRKRKNRKNRERVERKKTGGKIWSYADVETFDESDSDDADEDSEEMVDDDEDRDRKSRAMLKKLKVVLIPYLTEAGEYKCPWCFRKKMPTDYRGMLQHATYYGAGSQKHQAHLKAKHAAYGVFLLKHLPK